MVLKPCKSWGISTTNLNWWVYRMSEPSTMSTSPLHLPTSPPHRRLPKQASQTDGQHAGSLLGGILQENMVLEKRNFGVLEIWKLIFFVNTSPQQPPTPTKSRCGSFWFGWQWDVFFFWVRNSATNPFWVAWLVWRIARIQNMFVHLKSRFLPWHPGRFWLEILGP